MLHLLAAFANTPDNLQDYMESLSELRLHPDLYRRVDKPIRLRDGAMTVTIRSGYLVPIFSGRFAGEWEAKGEQMLARLRRQDKDAKLPGAGDRGSKELVGFVWTRGEGQVDTAMADRADALRFANHMVARVGYEREALADVVTRRSWTAPADEGIFLSIDPVVTSRFLAQGGGIEDPYEVIVYQDDDTEGALQRASTLLSQRLQLFEELDVHLAEDLAMDRTEKDRGIGTDQGAHAVFDVHTEHRYGRVIPRDGDPPQDRWLTHLRDDHGGLGRWRSVVLTAGRMASTPRKARLSGSLFPTDDPLAQRRAPARAEPVSASARIWAQPSHGGLALDVEFQTELTLRADGGPLLWVDLSVPKVEAIPDSFELVSLTDAAGTNLLANDRELRAIAAREVDAIDEDEDDDIPDENEERQGEDARDALDEEKQIEREDAPLDFPAVETLAFLPEVVPAGSEVKLIARWKDTWPLGQRVICSGAIERPSGASTGLQYFLPSPSNGDPGVPWRFEAAISVPAASPLYSAMSGTTLRTEEADGWRTTWSSADSTSALWPGVAVGRWKNIVEPAKAGLPAVTARLLTAYPGELEGFPPEVRRVIDYYQRWLPPFPADELEIFEAPSSCYGYVWIAPHGMVNLSRMITGAEVGIGAQPHLEHATFSHEIAHQYWGHLARPASIEDFWIAESFSEGFACMYVGAAFDPKACEDRMTKARRYWERRPDAWGGIASLSEAYTTHEQGKVVYEYGPYVMHEMLRRRIGKAAYFGALDVMLREHAHQPITTERLQHYFEAASGRDLSGFFDFWVYQGLVPAVNGRWHQDGKAVVGTLESDIPFGTFDIPVVVTDKERSESQWIEVVDGVGAFRFEGPWKKPKVELDPTFGTLARRRSMTKD